MTDWCSPAANPWL